MATFQEIMAAAVNADKAGDTEAAQMLVNMARAAGNQANAGAQSISPDDPQHSAVDVPKINEEMGPNRPRVDNFGDTIRAATEQPIAATKEFAKRSLDAGFEDPVGRIKNAGLTALSALGTAFSFGAGAVGETLGGSPTQEMKLARDLMMAGEVAVPELAGSSGALRASASAGRAAQSLDRAPTATQARARAADDLGITPALGAGGKMRGMTAATLEKVPGSGGTIANDNARFVGEVESTFSRVRDSIGTARSAGEAGLALQDGLKAFVTRFKAQSGKLYDEVGQKIPKGTTIQAPNTLKMISDALAPFASKPEIAKQLGLNKWASIAGDLEDGLSWEAASALRTSIGESLGKVNGALADMDQGKLKNAYKSLTNDLEIAAKAAGPEAEAAWKRANGYYRRGAEKIESDLDKTIRADSPERAFEAFSALTKGGRSTSNTKRLYNIKNSMSSNDWNTVSASIIDRLGQAKAGAQNADGSAFSVGGFLTEWNKLSKEAKAVLLPAEARTELEKLAKVAESAKSAGSERNFSNTGTIVAASAAGAGFMSAPLSTATLLGSAWAGSKALTNPAVLRAMNKAARGDSRQLQAIARGNNPYSRDVATLLRINAAESAQGGAAANDQSVPYRAAQ